MSNDLVPTPVQKMEEEENWADGDPTPPPSAHQPAINKYTNKVRAKLAGGLTILVSLIIVGSMIFVFCGPTDKEFAVLKEFLQITLVPLIPIWTSVLTYYFATNGD